MGSEWDGIERRGSSRDHDVLTRIDANLSNFMQRVEGHIDDDNEQFSELKKKVEESRWYVAIAIGVLSAVEFFKDKIFK